MSRLPAVVFALLAAATAGAFFVVQHLKVSTPLIAGFPAPKPAVINPVSGVVCGGVDHRRMRISFYLLHRSDDVDVYMIDGNGEIVATLATNRHMLGGSQATRSLFTWDGREDNGSVAPDGTYFIKVDLVHQGRTVVIAPTSGGSPSPVRVETHPPRPVVTSLSRHLIPIRGDTAVTVHVAGNENHPGAIELYRTDVPGVPKLVKRFAAGFHGDQAVWDGRIHGRPAPAGVYLVGLSVTDAACNTGHFPRRLPPRRGSTAGAGVTVRYLAVQPPMTPVQAGASATVYVDSRQQPYRWALRRPGVTRTVAHGTASGQPILSIRLPGGTAGVYDLSVRTGTHRTTVPLVACAPRPATVLVVLPALTWQGLNPVDDNGDGLPDTLTLGGPALLSRPLVDGLPSGWSDETALVAFLAATHRSFDVTTDAALTQGTGPRLAGHRGVILAGTERWVPGSLARALRLYVSGGGHVLTLGRHSLRATVTVTGGTARDPGPLRATDIFGVRRGPYVTDAHGLITVQTDELALFAKTPGVFTALPAYEPIVGVSAPAHIVSAAGTSPSAISIAGVGLGSGQVIEVGIAAFARHLTHNVDMREIFDAIWGVLTSRPSG